MARGAFWGLFFKPSRPPTFADIAQAAIKFRATTGYYSHKGADFSFPLKAADDIVRALPRLVEEFWMLAGDVYTPAFNVSCDANARFVASGMLVHIWLVPNPPNNPSGDFCLFADGYDPEPVQRRRPHLAHF